MSCNRCDDTGAPRFVKPIDVRNGYVAFPGAVENCVAERNVEKAGKAGRESKQVRLVTTIESDQ
jgi:hypothetical protein